MIIHHNFKYNGIHYDKSQLLQLAEEFLEKGKEFEKYLGSFILNLFDENDFVKVKTSGSTGEPKIIEIKKKSMLHSAIYTGDFFNLKPGDKILHCLPVNFISGKMMFIRALVLGLEMDYISPNLYPLDENSGEYDFAAMIPMQVQNSIHYLYKIKKLIIGGAKLNADLESKLLLLPTLTYETYGMTETISHIAARRVGEKYFTLLPNISIHKDTDDCLVIDAPLLNSELVKTNDLVEILNSNQFKFLGRIDNVINSGGVKLIPEEIESKLGKLKNRRFLITSKTDDFYGEKLVLLIEGEYFNVDNNTFKNLEKHEIPKEIIFKPIFEETENGKIKRNQIF